MMNLHDATNIIRMGLMWIGLVLYLFYLNWTGQKIIDTNFTVLKSMYV
jgi:hypothetical protein